MDNFLYQDKLFITFTNSGYLEYTLNLVRSTRKANVPWQLLVIALDQPTYEFLCSQNIACMFFKCSIPNSFIHYRDVNFNPICFIKLDVISWCLSELKNKDIYIVYLDSDIWVQKDFSSHLNKYKQYDIVFQCDEGQQRSCTPNGCTNYCAGFMMLRNNDIVNKLLTYTDPTKYLHDQDYINKTIHKYDIKCHTFDRNIFPNGVFVDNLPNDYSLIHYNYIEGHEKKEKMKKNGHWISLEL